MQRPSAVWRAPMCVPSALGWQEQAEAWCWRAQRHSVCWGAGLCCLTAECAWGAQSRTARVYASAPAWCRGAQAARCFLQECLGSLVTKSHCNEGLHWLVKRVITDLSWRGSTTSTLDGRRNVASCSSGCVAVFVLHYHALIYQMPVIVVCCMIL